MIGGLGWRGAADLACSAARPKERGATSPGLRRSPPPLTRGVARSEPGILSARTLRGSDGVIFRREEIVGGVGVTGGSEGRVVVNPGGDRQGAVPGYGTAP